jgi:hypothetical protein
MNSTTESEKNASAPTRANHPNAGIALAVGGDSDVKPPGWCYWIAITT